MIAPQYEACPMGGLHKVRPWQGSRTGALRQGTGCDRCHKTWEATLTGFEPTWKEKAPCPSTPT